MNRFDAATVGELLDATCDLGRGAKVINCVRHDNLPLTQRPNYCELCSTDISNHLNLAVAVNSWLNDWKDRAKALMRQQQDEIDALKRSARSQPRTSLVNRSPKP
jgi:hypothetical protein